MASNKYDASTTNTCHRFCRTETKNLQVPISSMVQQYNADPAAADQRHLNAKPSIADIAAEVENDF